METLESFEMWVLAAQAGAEARLAELDGEIDDVLSVPVWRAYDHEHYQSLVHDRTPVIRDLTAIAQCRIMLAQFRLNQTGFTAADAAALIELLP